MYNFTISNAERRFAVKCYKLCFEFGVFYVINTGAKETPAFMAAMTTVHMPIVTFAIRPLGLLWDFAGFQKSIKHSVQIS